MSHKTKSRKVEFVGTLAEQEADANSLILQIWKEKNAQQEDPYVLPDHLEQFKKSYQSIVKKQFQLPVLPMLSPRTQKKISAVPKPNVMEKLLLEKKTHEINKINPSIIYDRLTHVADTTRAAAHRKHMSVESVYATNQKSSVDVAFRGGEISTGLDLDTASTEFFASVARRKLRQQAQQLSLQQSFNAQEAARAPQRPPANPIRIDLSSSSYPFESSLKRLVDRNDSSSGKPALLSRSGTLPAIPASFVRDPNVSDESSTLSIKPEESVSDVDSIYASIRSPHRSKSQPKLGSNNNSNNNGNNGFSEPRILSKTSAVGLHAYADTTSIYPGAKVYKSVDAVEGHVNLVDIYQPVLAEVVVKSNRIMKTLNDTMWAAENTNYRELKSQQSYMRFLDQMKCDVLDELGVDVDEDFTRRRMFGEAVNLLVYYVSTCKLKTAFARLREKIRHVVHARRMMAAITISRAYRQLRNLKYKADLRRNLDLQRSRMQLAEKQIQDRMNAKSARISGLLRFRLIRRRVKEKFAARRIQSLVRGIRARVLTMELREWRQRRECAAIAIQCSFRQHLARRRFVLESKLLFVKQWMENIKTLENGKKLELRRNGAAQRIQAAYRTHRLRLFMRRMLYWHRMEIVMLVQKRFRGYVERVKYKKLLVERRKREKRKYDACVKIQRIVRGRIHYQAYKRHLHQIAIGKAERLRKKKLLLEQLKDVKKPVTWKDRWESFKPMKYLRDGVFAIKIQKVYRGHRAKRRVAVIRIKTGVIKYLKKQALRQRSAIVIQRMWRGKWQRLLIKKSKRQVALITLQCFFRQRSAIWKANKIRASIRAFQMLGHNMHKFMMRIKARRIRHMQIKFGDVVVVIQRLARRYLGKLALLHRKHSLRYFDEQKQFGEGKVTTALCSVQLRLIVDSLHSDISRKPPSLSQVDCPCNGPIQSLFIAAVGSRARTESAALITNKLDSKNFAKFSFRLMNFINDRMLSASFAEEEKIKPKRKAPKDQPRVAVLIEAIASDRFVVRKGLTGLSQTDLDLLFGEAKEDPTEGSTLTFKEFVHCVDMLANIYYSNESTKKSKTKTKAKKGTASTKPESVKSRSPSPSNSRPQSQSRVLSPTPTADGTSTGEGPIGDKSVRRRTRFDDSRNLLAPLSLICGSSPQLGLLLCLQLMSEYRSEKWMMAINAYLETESRQRLGLFVIRIQCLVRRRLARKRRAELALLHEIKMRELALTGKVTFIQSIIRRFICRRRVSRRAQTFIIKYVTHDATTYWYNPSTRLSTWTKPKILGDFDCTTIPLPETGLEVMVRCNNCNKDGEVTCVQCEDTYCSNCYFSIHCKGNRRTHTHKVISKCSFCKFQVATKNCMTCILSKPVRGSAQSFMKESDRGRYCDPCFCHAHDAYEIELSKDSTKKKAMLEFVSGTKEAYILGQYLHQKLKTNHKFEHLVQTCEECQWRCASWRCDDCNQIYCHKCLVGLHAAGGPFFSHKAEKLPFYTNEMHAKYQKDAEDQIMASRMIALIQSTKLNDDEKRYQSVLLIQKWWRGRYYARAGKAILKTGRKKIRHAWRLRKREDAERRRGFVYRLRDALGRNPPLPTDSREEAALREVNIFRREKARACILRNLEDWGWYRVSSTEPRKGVPRTGFDVGTVDELISQAKLGGVRLPGKVFLENGKSTHRTAMPLSDFINTDKMVRIGEHLFYVRGVDEEMITFDRKWINSDRPAGEIMYCVPCTKDEEDGLYYKRKHAMRAFLLNNSLTQSAIGAYVSFLKSLSGYALYMARTAKKNGSVADAIEWRDMSLNYDDQVKHMSQYLIGDTRRVKPAPSSKTAKSAKSAKSKRLAIVGGGEDAATEGKEETDGANSAKPSSKMVANALASARSNAVADDNSIGTEEKKQQYAEEMQLPMHLRFGRKPGVRWTATPDELLIRKEQEAKMTTTELISTADDWEEDVNPMTGAVFYHNKVTNEISDSIPRSLQAKRQLDEDSLAAKKKVQDAAAKMDVFTKKSVKMTSKRR